MSKAKCDICGNTETAAERRECELAQRWARELVVQMEAEIYDPAADVVDPWEKFLDDPYELTEDHPNE